MTYALACARELIVEKNKEIQKLNILLKEAEATILSQDETIKKQHEQLRSTRENIWD